MVLVSSRTSHTLGDHSAGVNEGVWVRYFRYFRSLLRLNCWSGGPTRGYTDPEPAGLAGCPAPTCRGSAWWRPCAVAEAPRALPSGARPSGFARKLNLTICTVVSPQQLRTCSYNAGVGEPSLRPTDHGCPPTMANGICVVFLPLAPVTL